MAMLVRIAITALLLALQAAIVIAVRRTPTSTLVRWRFMHFRGEEWSKTLTEVGAEMRENAERSRSLVTVAVVLATSPLDVVAALVWMF